MDDGPLLLAGIILALGQLSRCHMQDQSVLYYRPEIINDIL